MDFSVADLAELISTVLGIVAVYLLGRGDGRGWPLGAVMVVLMAYVYWDGGLLGSCWLQAVFFPLQLLGWWRWVQGREKDLRVSCRLMSWSERLGSAALWGLAWWALALFLEDRGGQYPRWDGFVTSGSLVAQATMVAGRAESWLVWIVVDLIYIGLSLAAEMPAYAVLYLVFTGLAFKGWREWTRRDIGEDV